MNTAVGLVQCAPACVTQAPTVAPELVTKALEEEALAKALDDIGSNRAFEHRLAAYGYAHLAGVQDAKRRAPEPQAFRLSSLLGLGYRLGRRASALFA